MTIISVFKIISKINMAQDERFQSFPLFSLCSSLATYLYPIKMKTIKTFVSTMTISGAGYSTGKSLMYEICMLALYGKRLNNTVPNTIPQLYDMLASGIPIYGKFPWPFDGHRRLFLFYFDNFQ